MSPSTSAVSPSTLRCTAAFRFSSAGVTLLWATPNPGYQAEIEPEGTGLKVEFENGSHRSRVDVWWDGAPRSEIRERAD